MTKSSSGRPSKAELLKAGFSSVRVKVKQKMLSSRTKSFTLGQNKIDNLAQKQRVAYFTPAPKNRPQANKDRLGSAKLHFTDFFHL